MAKATKATERVEKVVFEDKEVITLKLSREEALALSAITSKISGCPETTPRAYFDNIRNALEELGIFYGYRGHNPYYDGAKGFISFDNVKK